MGGLGGFFANAGLVSQGFNDAGYERDLRQANLDQLKQTATERGQRIQNNQMGLDDATLTRKNAAGMRATVSAHDPAAGSMALTKAIGDTALKQGDAAGYTAAQEGIKKAEQEGFSILTNGAARGIPPAAVERQFNAMGSLKIQPGTLEYGKDPKSGSILLKAVDASTGQPFTLNATAYIQALNTKTHVIKANEILVSEGSGRTIADNPVDEFSHGDNGQIFNKRTGTETRPRTAAPPQVHFNPAGGNAIVTSPEGVSEIQPATEAVPATTGVLGSGFGAKAGKPGSPARVVPLGGADKPPVEGARKAPDGNWYVQQGQGWAKVVPGDATVTPPPAAVEPVKPTAKPKEQVMITDDTIIPEVAAPAQTISPKERAAAARVEAARVEAARVEAARVEAARVEAARVEAARVEAAAAVKARTENEPKQRMAATFRAIAGAKTMTRDDAPLIEEAMATGLLTATEMEKAKRMLAALKPQTTAAR